MLAEHYSEEEYDSILLRVAAEAKLLQRQLIMKDYSGALKDGFNIPPGLQNTDSEMPASPSQQVHDVSYE